MPLYSRDSDVDFLFADPLQDGNGFLLRFALKFLKAVISYEEHHAQFLAAITLWSTPEGDRLVPYLFVCRRPLRTLRSKLVLEPPKSLFAKSIKKMIPQVHGRHEFEVFQDTVTDPSSTRVLISLVSPPYRGFVPLHESAHPKPRPLESCDSHESSCVLHDKNLRRHISHTPNCRRYHGLRHSHRLGTRCAILRGRKGRWPSMVTTLRTKLLIGVAPLVVIMVALGLWAIVMFSRLGNNIDKILKENYRSVLAAEGMKESIERVDSAYLFAIGGEENRARSQYAENRKNFETHLQIELSNITLPGEREAAEALRDLQTRYFRLGDEFFAIPAARKDERTTLYFARLLPTFNEVKREANSVLDMNQKNMEEERDLASHAAALVDSTDDPRLIGRGGGGHGHHVAIKPDDPRTDRRGDALCACVGARRPGPGRTGRDA